MCALLGDARFFFCRGGIGALIGGGMSAEGSGGGGGDASDGWSGGSAGRSGGSADGRGGGVEGLQGLSAADPGAEAVEVEIHDRSGVQGEQLADHQAADNGDAQRAAEFRAVSTTDGDGDAGE